MKLFVTILILTMYVFSAENNFFDDTPITEKSPSQSPKISLTGDLRELQKQDSIQKHIAKHIADSIRAYEWERDRPLREAAQRAEEERVEQKRRDRLAAEEQARREREARDAADRQKAEEEAERKAANVRAVMDAFQQAGEDVQKQLKANSGY